jgi:cellulose synthase/poly-beta-1,6-N-acetylglucosamine synthase-like glycosyltransferase
VHAGSDAPPFVQISNFAMLVKNLVRARGLYRLGGSSTLFGTGMALPWSVFRSCRLGSSDIVEDLRLSIDLARQGVRVHLAETACVTSGSAALHDSLGQRRRWEHGFLYSASRWALPLLASGVAAGSRQRIMLGLHLCVPPFSLLLSIAALSGFVVSLLSIVTSFWWPTALLFTAIMLTLLAIVAAWQKEGRQMVSLGTLGRAPQYVLKKIPVYVSFVTSRQTDWNRTERPGES